MRYVFSTDALDPEARFEGFRDALMRGLFNFDLVARRDRPYRGAVDLFVGGPVVFGQVLGSEAAFARSPAMARRCEEGVWVLLTRSGRMRLTQGDVQHDLAPGDGVVIDAVRAHAGQCVLESDTWVAQVPDSVLRSLRAPGAANGTTLLPGGSAVTRMMLGVIEAHHRIREDVSADLGALTGRYVADLVALALGANADGREIVRQRGLKAGRLQAVLAAIERRACDPAFSLDGVARQLGISRRYVQHLLKETGHSFNEHVTERRLQRALALLRDPRATELRVIDIALATGFGDVSHFNRLFRRRFGDTPTGVRDAGDPGHEA